MTKIVCISDTHTQHSAIEIPKCDLLIHAGDFSYSGKIVDVLELNQWFGKLKEKGIVKEIILTAGNHDWICEKNPSWTKEAFTNCIYLDEEPCEVFGFKVFGSPIQPEFCNWAFNRKRGEEIARHWAKIPDDTQILVTHGPPMGILDECPDMFDSTKTVHVGCEELKERIDKLKNLKAHIFGHIHEGNGVKNINGVTYVNASIMTGDYQPTQPYHTITL